MAVLLSAENTALLNNSVKQGTGILEAVLCEVLPVIAFGVVYYLTGFSVRFYDPWIALIFGPILFGFVAFALCCWASYVYSAGKWLERIENASFTPDAWRMKYFKPPLTPRFWTALAVCMVVSVLSAFLFANVVFWSDISPYYTYDDLVSYTDIDPSVDQGRSYMDAGEVYFRESTFVQTTFSQSFHNGITYCVAPIIRQPLFNQNGDQLLSTYTNFVLPPSGTVDWWAVGEDCCGPNGTNYKCPDVTSMLARSGLRLVNDNARPMYLLAVQEWSATTGLPVFHPLFFKWTENPISDRDKMLQHAWSVFGFTWGMYALCNCFVAFFVYMFLRKMNIC